MGDVKTLLAAHYLPHAEAFIADAYSLMLPGTAISTQFAELHVYMWKMSLTRDDYDLSTVRRAITRSGYDITYVELDEIDEVVCSILLDLVQEYGCDFKAEMRTAIAVAAAGLNFSSLELAAA